MKKLLLLIFLLIYPNILLANVDLKDAIENIPTLTFTRENPYNLSFSTGDPLSKERIKNYLIFNITLMRAEIVQDIICLSLNIYHEARGDSYEGQIATAFVVKNRLNNSNFPNTYCAVIWQYYKTNNGRYIAQFSWTRDGISDIPKNKNSWIIAQKIAYLVYMNYDIYDLTGGRLNYYAHNSISTPIWAKNIKSIIIGKHTFLTAKEHLYLP